MRTRLEPRYSSVIVLLATFLSSLAWAGTTIRVPADQPTIQAGISAANNGDTVLVSAGTYYENINFIGKAITVKSAQGPGVTIIDGQQAGAVVSFISGETSSSVISGFTIRNGSFGGVNTFNASPIISGNVITENCSDQGGVQTDQGAPLIEGNLISGNLVGPLCSGYFFAAVSSTYDSGTQIKGNLIVGNGGGGIYLISGGTPIIQQNSILENFGPGVNLLNSGTVITQNLITANQGVGITGLGGSTQVLNNTIVSNGPGGCCSASEVYVADMSSQMTMKNNLLIGTAGVSALYCQSYESSPVFTSNDVFVNGAEAYGGMCPDMTGTGGNISADPLFVDMLSSNYHIQSASPAVNAGDNSATGLPAHDFDGDPRFVGQAVDIGVDEYRIPTTLSLSSYAIHYASQQVGTSSAPVTVTLTNGSKNGVTITLIATGSNFSQTNNCGSALAGGASCKISVVFSPTIGGAINSALGVFTSATVNPQAVTLNGFGLAPAVTLSNQSMYFYGQVVGTVGTQTSTLTNSGLAPLSISSFSVTGATDFSQSNNCPVAPATLASGASCIVTVAYAPTILTNYETASVLINDSAIPSPQNLFLTGSTVSAGNPVLSPNSLTFPTTLIGQTSSPQTVTLTNTGTGRLGIENIFTYGDFLETNNCPASLGVNASCTVVASYAPTAVGTEYGGLEVLTDSAVFIVQATFTGTGEAPVPTITSLSQSSVPTGSSDTQITITGTGFVNGSQVLWNGNALTNCCVWFLGNTQLMVTIPAGNLSTPGTYQVSVLTRSPGGGTSNSVPFTVYTPVNYASQSTTYNYRAFAGTNLNFNSMYQGAQLTSPFPIQFGGGSYTNLTVGPGGMISFNGFFSPYNDVIPTSQTPLLVAPMWMPLYGIGTGTDNNVFWEVTGTTPNRQLVIEWRDLGICCETTNTVRFEVVFFEGSGNVVFNYADTVFGGSSSGSDNGAQASVGMQVAPGQGTQFSYYQPALSSKSAILWYPNAPSANLSTSSISFGYHQVGTPSVAQVVTLTNGALVPLNISSMSIDNPDFTETSNCGTTLGSHKSCTIKLFFNPSQPTNETGTLTISDNATNSPQTVALSGTGTVTGVTVFPILVNFGSVAVNSTASAPATLANGTNQPLTIQQIVATPSVFTDTSNCGASVAPGQACTVAVSFTPTQQGSVQGILSMGLNRKAVKPVSKLVGAGK